MGKLIGGVEYMTTEEAANYLGIAPKTLQQYRWRGQPHIPFLKVENACWYLQSDLDAYLAAARRNGRKSLL